MEQLARAGSIMLTRRVLMQTEKSTVDRKRDHNGFLMW